MVIVDIIDAIEDNVLVFANVPGFVVYSVVASTDHPVVSGRIIPKKLFQVIGRREEEEHDEKIFCDLC